MARLFVNTSDRTEQFICLWTATQPNVANLISAAVPHLQQSQDILQNVALTCLREFSEYDERLSFDVWALQIAKSRIQVELPAPPT